MARTKISSGRATTAAAGVVPEPSEHAAPPHEPERDAWDADAETLELDAAPARDTPPPSTKPNAGAAGRSLRASPHDGVHTSPPSSGRGWGAVIETTLTLDPEAVFARLYDELRLGDAATEYGAVLDACDRAEQNTVDAVRLARHAKLEDEEVTRKANERLEVLRSSAKRELVNEVEASKDEKGKATMRAPTIQDIDDRMIANWPDEYSSLKRRQEEMHGALRIAEGMAESWRSRCATLRMILDRVAPSRPR